MPEAVGLCRFSRDPWELIAMWYVRCAGWSVLTLFFWGATAIGFWGWGALCRAALRLPPPTRLRRTNTCLWGVCSTLFALQLAHCAVAINSAMLGGWYLVGLAGALIGTRGWLPRWRSGDKRRLSLYVAAAGWLMYVAFSSMTRIPQSDHYHFSAIRWQQAFPIVPGLANLDGRLGFNNASFLLHSLFSSAFEEFGLTFFHGALYLILLSSALDAVVRAAVKRRIAVVDAWDLLTLCPLIVIGLDYRDTFALANVSPDLTLWLLQIGLVRTWIAAFHSLAAGRSSAACGENLVLALFLAVACVCTKLSGAAFSAGLIVISTGYLVVKRIDWASLGPVSWGRAGAALLACATIWAGRGMILSGHPLYPSSLLALPVEWRVAESMRGEDLQMITDWGRYAYPFSSSHGDGAAKPWLADWCRRFFSIGWTNPPKFNTVGRSVFPVCLLLMGSLLWARGPGWPQAREAWVPLFGVAGGLALAVWLTTAPDPRFAVGIWYALAIVFFIPTVCRCDRRQRNWLVGLLALTAATIGVYDRARTERGLWYRPRLVFGTVVLPRPQNESGRYKIAQPTLTKYSCDSGLVIYECDCAWHAPLASVGFLYDGWNSLRLRSPQIGLRAGFVRQ